MNGRSGPTAMASTESRLRLSCRLLIRLCSSKGYPYPQLGELMHVSRILAATLVAAAAASTAPRAQEDIPPDVIDQCNATSSAHELPDCLKSGAVAVEMIAIAQSEQFYGADAGPVL